MLLGEPGKGLSLVGYDASIGLLPCVDCLVSADALKCRAQDTLGILVCVEHGERDIVEVLDCSVKTVHRRVQSLSVDL